MAASKRSFLKGFFAGLAAGLLLSLIVAVWIGRNNPFVEPPTAPKTLSESQTPPKEAPSYDFYKTLPGQVSPPSPVSPVAPITSPSKPDFEYLLQTGAFLNAADAEEMKAKLALLGFEANVVLVEDAEAIRLHKVRVGPFKSLDELNKARARLTQNSIDTLLIKAPPKNVPKETP